LIYTKLQNLTDTDVITRYWKKQKLKETESLLLACSGLWLEASAADFMGIPGNKTDITAQVIMRNSGSIKLNKISWLGQSDTVPALQLKQNELYSFKRKEILPAEIPFSNPYWLNETHSIGLFTVKDQQLIGQPENAAAANVVFDIEISGLQLQIKRELINKRTDPVKGEIYRPFEILPPATVTLSEKVYVFSGTTAKTIAFTIKANATNTNGSLIVSAPEGWSINIKDSEFKLANKGEETIIEANVIPGKINGKISAALKKELKAITPDNYVGL